jgi:hypothetical protein
VYTIRTHDAPFVGRWVERMSSLSIEMQDINAPSLPGSPEGSFIAKAQGCGLAATMGLRDQET